MTQLSDEARRLLESAQRHPPAPSARARSEMKRAVLMSAGVPAAAVAASGGVGKAGLLSLVSVGAVAALVGTGATWAVMRHPSLRQSAQPALPRSPGPGSTPGSVNAEPSASEVSTGVAEQPVGTSKAVPVMAESAEETTLDAAPQQAEHSFRPFLGAQADSEADSTRPEAALEVPGSRARTAQPPARDPFPLAEATPPSAVSPPTPSAPEVSGLSSARYAPVEQAHVGEELRLLAEAVKHKNASRWRETLEVVERYQARFAEGVLLPEALALKVMSLCEVGQVEQAKATAERLSQLAPNSPGAKRSRMSCAGE